MPDVPPVLGSRKEETVAIVRARARRRRPLHPRALAWNASRAVLFAVSAVALAVLADGGAGPGWPTAVALVAAYAVAWRVELETATGVVIPSVLAICPMLVLLDPATVPLAAAAGGLLADIGRDQPLRRMLGTLACGLPLVPASLVLLATERPDGPRGAALVCAALAVWVAGDAAAMYVSQRWVHRDPAAGVGRVVAMYRLEPALAAIALPAALASAGDLPFAFLAPFAIVAVFAQLSRERRARTAQALMLSRAYRGTARLLGGAITADDGYTGDHSRSVVGLAVAAATELGLDEEGLQATELAALLHDVGKMRVPKPVLNKPGPLSPAERAIVERHATDGAAMLDEVGGYLTEIGRLVRHHHERWDGRGYPDGLAGPEIPLVSRIVAVCDAYSAMTTDRPYRAAMTPEHAVAELRRGAGHQFDPAVVAAVVALVRARVAGRDARSA